jgi:uncharacterized protein YbbC (DUF1343 family)
MHLGKVTRYVFVAAAVSSALLPAPGLSQAHVEYGVDRLSAAFPKVLEGKRVGLITNHTGHDRHGTPTIDLLAGRKDMKLVALFAPEHGIRGSATGRIEFERDAKTGLPVHSLFGQTQKPTPEMLDSVDALVYDIQDVGVRQYTYISTLGLAMQAAAEKKIPIVVLDRPNPIGGEIIEGNIREDGLESFVGLYPIASRYGLTVGEIAGMYNDFWKIGADLHVVKMAGWKRDLWMDKTDLPWTGPSPNLPMFEGVIHYPGTVFFEGTNVSEGRGSEAPFELIGAPYIRAKELADSMNALKLPGVRFVSQTYPIKPTGRKYPGETIHGVRLHVTDRQAYRPVATSMRLMAMIRKLHPNDFQWRCSRRGADSVETCGLDRLTGSTRIRAAIENGTLDQLLAEWDRDAEKFREQRKPYLLY